MAIGKFRLRQQLQTSNALNAQKDIEFPGMLGAKIGNATRVEIPNRGGYVYVRLHGNLSELISAYNDQVPLVYDLPVVVVRDKANRNKWRIKGKDFGKYEDWGTSPYLPFHGDTHSFNPYYPGADIAWIYSRQFMPLLVMPSGSYGAMSVTINEGAYHDLSNQIGFVVETATTSLSGYKPTDNQAKMLLISLNSSGTFSYTEGSSFAANVSGSAVYPFIPAPPSDSLIDLAAIRLVSGTAIIEWEDIYDVRQLVAGKSSSGGTGSGDVTSSGASANEIATFSASKNIEGDPNLTWDGATFSVTGDTSLNGPLWSSAVNKSLLKKTINGTVASDTEVVIANNATGIAITLPASAGLGRSVYISNINDGLCRVIPAGSDIINTGTSVSLSRWEGILLVDRLTGYWVITSDTRTSTSTSGMTNPMTAQGDIIYGGAGGTPTALTKGSALQILRMNSGDTAPEWATITGTVNSFLGLIDTPDTYVGAANYGVFVNSSGTALTFSPASASDPGTFHSGTANEFSGLTEKSASVTNDWLLIEDAAASGTKKKLQISNLPLSTGTFSGGNSTYTDIYANRPATGTAGNLFFPSDGFTIERDTGGAWVPWGPLYKFTTQPIVSDFTWVNQGSGTATQEKGSVTLYDQPGTTTLSLRILAKNQPSKPYVITAAFLPVSMAFDYQYFGIGWRDSATGKLALLKFTLDLASGWYITSVKHADPTATGTAYFSSSNQAGSMKGPIWLRMADNNSNRICSVSYDGQNFTQIHTVGNTDYITANQVVVLFQARSATLPNYTHWLTWTET